MTMNISSKLPTMYSVMYKGDSSGEDLTNVDIQEHVTYRYNYSVLPMLDIYTEREALTPTYRYSITIILSAVIVFTCCGNLLTIISVATQKHLQTVGNMYIASLAGADLIVSSLIMTVMLSMTVIQDEWLLGSICCDIWTFLENVSCTASLTNVTLIAWDRYNTVAWPLKALRKRTKRRATWLILIAWLIPIMFWTALSTSVRMLNGMSPSNLCFLIWKPGPLVISAVVLSVYLPIIAILVFFSLMMYVLRGHMVKMNDNMRRSASGKNIKSYTARQTIEMENPSIIGSGIPFNPRLSVDVHTSTDVPRSKSFLASSGLSISALSLNGLSNIETLKECDFYASLESLPQDSSGLISTAKRSVGTSTSPERYGLIRSVGVNTSPSHVRPSNLPDVANVGQNTTRDTYHRGIKRMSHRKDIFKGRYLNVEQARRLSRTSSLTPSFDSAKSTSVESDDSGRSQQQSDEVGKRKLGAIGRQLSIEEHETSQGADIVEQKVNALEPKIKLMSLGRSSSSESSRGRDLDHYLRVGSLVRLRQFGRSLSEESSASDDKARVLKAKPHMQLSDVGRSASDDSNESRNESNHLTVAEHLWRTPSWRKHSKLSQASSGSQDSSDSRRFLRVRHSKKLSDIGRSVSNDSTDSRLLQVEPKVRFCHLGRSLSVDYDTISILSSASHATSKDYQQLSQQKADASARLRRDRYASLMRRERHTTLKQCRLRQQLRAAKTLGLITAFLLVFWLPLAIMWPVKTFCPTCFSTRVYDIAKWATCLNSAVNPIIYCMCNAQFRKAFKKIVLRK